MTYELFEEDRRLNGLFEVLGDRIVLYHGTTSEFERLIENEGLRPNEDTEIRNFRGSRPELVYLGIVEVAFQYCFQACKNHGGNPVLLEVTVSTASLTSDQDSGIEPQIAFKRAYLTQINSLDLDNTDEPRWLTSMLRTGTCAREGAIDSESIKVYKTQGDFSRLAAKIIRLRGSFLNISGDRRINVQSYQNSSLLPSYRL